MPLRDHLVELRNRIIYSVIGIAVAAVAGWFLFDPAFEALQRPLLDAASRDDAIVSVNFAGLATALDMHFKVAFFLGLILSSPWWLYQVWAYVAPGLTGKERRYMSALWSRSQLDVDFLRNDPPLQIFVVLAVIGGIAGLAGGAGIAWLLGVLVPALPTHTPWLYALYAEILARSCRSTSTSFFVTSVIPLIPGSTLYYCMRSVVEGNLHQAWNYGRDTFLYALGIAAGMSIAWAICDFLRKIRGKQEIS